MAEVRKVVEFLTQARSATLIDTARSAGATQATRRVQRKGLHGVFRVTLVFPDESTAEAFEKGPYEAWKQQT